MQSKNTPLKIIYLILINFIINQLLFCFTQSNLITKMQNTYFYSLINALTTNNAFLNAWTEAHLKYSIKIYKIH